MTDKRTAGRAAPPEGFPHGRLAAGELAAVIEAAEASGDYFQGAAYGLSPERKAEFSAVAMHLGLPPNSQGWISHLAAGHVARVAERIPASIKAETGLAADKLSDDFATRMSLLASLDQAAEEARQAAEAAREAAELAGARARNAAEAFAQAAETLFDAAPEAVRKVAEAQARGAVEPTIVLLERRVKNAETRIGRAADAAAEKLKAAAEEAVAEADEGFDAAGDRLASGLIAALRKTARDAKAIGRAGDPWMPAKLAAAVAFAVAMCGMSAWMGYGSGHEAGKAAARVEAKG